MLKGLSQKFCKIVLVNLYWLIKDLRREIEQKLKEIKFYKKEAQLWKKDLEVTQRENNQMIREVENYKKDLEQNIQIKNPIEENWMIKRKKFKHRKESYQELKKHYNLIHDESFRRAQKVSIGTGNNQDRLWNK